MQLDLSYTRPKELSALELFTFEIKRADYNIFKILSNIPHIKKSLIQDAQVFYCFTQAIESYVTHSQILTACLDSPETYRVKCKDIQKALQGMPPEYFVDVDFLANPPPSSVDNSFFLVLSNAIDGYVSGLNRIEMLEQGYLSEIEAIHGLIHLTEHIAYCHPVDPYTPPPAQSKGGKARSENYAAEKLLIIELWHTEFFPLDYYQKNDEEKDRACWNATKEIIIKIRLLTEKPPLRKPDSIHAILRENPKAQG